MISRHLKTASHVLICGGIICQAAAFLDGSLSWYRYWSPSAAISLFLLGSGYYANLRSKGYIPFRIGWLYGLTVLSLLPFLGPLAAAGKLKTMPACGEPKETRPVVHGIVLVLIAASGVVV